MTATTKRRARTIGLVDHTREHRPPPGVLEAIAEALTIQVERDFAPAWNLTPVRFTVGGRGDKIHFFDSAHQATDYGWHVVDNHGQPYAHVFAEPSIASGSDWITGPDSLSSTASHEALEMLADPAANGYSFDGRRRLWAQEVCDPVQARTYRITARRTRIPVSDFVLPSYFDRHAAGPYDHLGALTKPFSIDHGGYAVYQRAGADYQQNSRRFHVVFDTAVPRWLRTQKLEGLGSNVLASHSQPVSVATPTRSGTRTRDLRAVVMGRSGASSVVQVRPTKVGLRARPFSPPIGVVLVAP